MKQKVAKSLAERFWSKVDRSNPAGCWPWIGAINPRGGEGNFAIRVQAVDGHPAFRTVAAYRVAFELANGPIPSGSHVLHSCDNRRCVRPEHLRLGTHSDNMRDMWQRNPQLRKGKLTAEQVGAIRKEYFSTPSLSCGKLGRRYGVNAECIRQIVLGRHWRKAGGPVGPTKPQRGEIVRTAKLNEFLVREIIYAYRQGTRCKDLAVRFGVSYSTIFFIVSGRNWRHVWQAIGLQPELIRKGAAFRHRT